MFKGCKSLTDINSLQNWNTQQVTNMYGMFEGCTSLNDITSLQNWNTTKVTDMSWMFEGCTSLVDLSSLSNWDISKADTTDIFSDCKSVKAYPTWGERSKTATSDSAHGEYVDSFFKLKEAINNDVKNIVLVSDISFGGQITLDADDLTIYGNGHTLNANGYTRFFTIKGKNITFNSLTFKNGHDHTDYSSNRFKHHYRGGAIYNHGSCTFNDCKFINNSAGRKIGEDIPERATAYHSFYASGGAIYNGGKCTLINCIFEGNKVFGEFPSNPDYGPSGFTVINDPDEEIHESNTQKDQEKSITDSRNAETKKDITTDKRLTSEYLKEFEKLNTTTKSIFELENHKALIILKDETNLTRWEDVKNKFKFNSI